MNENIEKPNFKEIVLLNIQQLTNFPYIEKDFDALTDYGLLSKVVEKMNEVITNNNIQNETINSLYEAFLTLKNYIDNYFNNLDVQEEINNKLEEMSESGELTLLIKNYVDPIYQDYETEINLRMNQQDQQITEINSKVNSVASGSPLVASSISDMTDTTRTYVLTTDGHWYYYDGTEWQDGGIYQSTGISETDPVIENIEENIDRLNNEVFINQNIQSLIYPGTVGRINTSGVIISSQTYSYTSKFFYAKKGTYLHIDDTTYGMRVGQYSTPNTSSVISASSSTVRKYTCPADNWYLVSVMYIDSSQTASESILEQVSADVLSDTRSYVYDYTSLNNALISSTVRDIYFMNDIKITSGLTISDYNKHIHGNNFKLEGTNSITYLLSITKSKTIIEDLILTKAQDDVLYVGNNGNVYLKNCDISYSYENDGVGLHGNSNVYIYDSKIHDNYDEGLSTHDTSYCECYNVEAYNNGYEIETSTPSGISFGGLHFGGSRMGKAINCYCHNNNANGIGFITIDNNFSSSAKSICKGNICKDNDECGIKFGGCYNLVCGQNICVNNVNGIVFYKKENHGNTGYIAKNSCFSNSSSQQTIWTDGDAGLIFEN